MSIFHKKGSGVQGMLFGGTPKASAPSTPAHANGARNGQRGAGAGGPRLAAPPADEKTNHEVFFVRGRPFIAPTVGGGNKNIARQELFQTDQTAAAENELSLKRVSNLNTGQTKLAQNQNRTAVMLARPSSASAATPDGGAPSRRISLQNAQAVAAHNAGVAMPSSPTSGNGVPRLRTRSDAGVRHAQMDDPLQRGSAIEAAPAMLMAPPSLDLQLSAGGESGPPSAQSAKRASKVTSSLASASKIAEEEWAALFRNNLLRSCWKPGLSAAEVQHILTRWEKKLVESMHRWLHPELWVGFHTWHHSTYPHALIAAMRHRLMVRLGWPALAQWRSAARIRALRHFLLGRVLLPRVRDWRLETALRTKHKRIVLLFRFRRWTKRLRRKLDRTYYLRSLRMHGVRRAYNSWVAHCDEIAAAEAMKIATLSRWRSPCLRAFNEWKERLLESRRMALVALRWSQYSLYRLWRRWAVGFTTRMLQLRAAVARWQGASLSMALNSWVGYAIARARYMKRLRKGLSGFAHRHARAAFNSWRFNGAATELRKHRMLSALETLRGSKRRAAFLTWSDRAAERLHTSALLHRALGGLTSKLLWGFNAWASALEPADSAISRALGHLVHQSEAKAFHRWLSLVDALFSAHAALSLAAGALFARHTRLALNTWSEFCRLLGLKRRVLLGLRGNGLLRGLNKWAQYAEERLEATERLSSALKALRNIGLRKGFNTLAALLSRPADPAMRAIAHMVHAEIARALRTWQQHTENWRRLYAALGALVHRAAKQALTTWIAYAAESASGYQTLRRALAACSDPRVKAWNTWAGQLDGYYCVKRALNRLCKGRELKGINTWVSYTHQRLKMRRVYMRFARHAETTALRTWRLHSTMAREKLTRLTAKVSKALAGPIFLCINKWRNLASKRKSLYRVAASLVLARQRLAFNTLSYQCARTLEARRRARAALRTLSPEGRKLRKGLTTWKIAHEGWQLARRALLRLTQSSLVRAFLQWEHASNEAAYAKERLASALYALSPDGRRVRKGFNSMLQMLERAMTLRRALARMTLISIVKCLATWRERKDAWCEKRKLFAHLLHRELSKGWTTWREYGRLLTVAGRAMSAMRGSGLVRGMNQWVSFAETRIDALDTMRRALGALRHAALRKAFNKLAGLLEAPPDVAVRALAYLLHHELAKGFASWLSITLSISAAFTKMHRAAGHWLAMKLARVINSWEGYIQQRLLLQRANHALAHAKHRQGFATWQAYSSERRVATDKMAARLRVFSASGFAMRKGLNAWKATYEEMRVMRRALMCFTSGALVRSVRKWAAVAELAENLRRALFRMRNVALVRAIRTWRGRPTGAKATATQAAARLLNQQLSRGFEKWASVHMGLLFLKRAAGHLANRAVAMAWRAWEARVDEQHLMARALSSLLQSATVRAMNTWVGWAEARLEAREKIASSLRAMLSHVRAAFNSWHARTAEPDVGSRAIRHLANRGLSMGWRSWVSLVEKRERLRCALAHLVGHGLVKAITTWEEYVEGVKMLRRALGKLVHRASAAALATWKDYLEVRSGALAQMRTTLAAFRGPHKKALTTWRCYVGERLRARATLSKLLHHGQWKALSRWKATCQAKTAQRHRMRAALLALTSGLTAGFNSWRDVTLELKLAKRALSSLFSRSKRLAYNSWAAAAGHRAAKRARMRSALASLFAGDLRKALNKWCELVERLEPLRHAAAHIVYASAAKALGTWLDYIDMLETKRRTLLHVCNQDLAKGWRGWIAHVELRYRMADVLRDLVNVGIARALRRWANSAHEREEKLRIMRGTLYTLAGGHRTKLALNTWRALLTSRQRALYALSAFVHGASRRAWNVWAHRAAVRRENMATMAGALMFEERKALNTWKENALHDAHARASFSHWRYAERNAGWRKWKRVCANGATLKRALGHFSHMAEAKCWRGWLEAVEQMHRLQRAFGSWGNMALLQGFNSWLAYAAHRDERWRKAKYGLSGFFQGELRRTWNSWRNAIEALLPVRRAMAHWKDAPRTRALFRLKQCAANRIAMKRRLFRMFNLRLSKGFNTLKAKCARSKKVGRYGLAFLHRLLRRGLNSWQAWMKGRRRLQKLVKAWQAGPGVRAGFWKWKAATRRRPPELLGAPVGFRAIRTMTWREVCVWLHRIGIPVARSPPTLLRTLKMGGPYLELVRRVSPAFYVRHKMDKIANPLSLFQALQSFMETELVVRALGFQRLDVRALEEGKAIEHLELLASMREIVEEINELDAAHRRIIYNTVD